MSLSVSIKKKFGNFELDSSFETDGTILGFLGASGCGKSMTLKCIAGIVTPDEGRIVLNGRVLFDKAERINLPPQQRRIGYLFQNYGLFPNMTLEQNIMCGLCREKDKSKKREAVADIIQKMMLSGLEKHRPSQLSGGQQQRTALARILIGRPELLLLDEPFSALDAYLKLKLETEMKKLLEDFGKDVILVSHNRDEVYHLCNHLAIMDQGHFLGQGNVKEMFRNPGSVQGAVLTGCKNIETAVKSGDHEVFVPAWNKHFTCDQPVGDSLRAVGIRAHYFNAKTTQNAGKTYLVETMEEPFEMILKFRYEGADPSSEPIWWRIPKDKNPGKFPEKLGVAPQNVMLLYS
ncbi:MAG: ATP-binding cassette domain-containing protein [Clostridiales bacterium]|nr:ATP-binding cassette domain-containing protein [Clostridiales bacterium]